MEERRTFDTGAVRCSDADEFRFDLITPIGLKRIARTYANGAKKYSDHNWRKGIPMTNLLNHCLVHIFKYLEGLDDSEDHLAHAAWNLLAAMHMEEVRPDMNDIYTVEEEIAQATKPEVPGVGNPDQCWIYSPLADFPAQGTN